MSRIALLLLLLAVMPMVASADEARFAEALGLYENQQFEEASEAFKAMIRDDGPHPATLLGLGNSAYRRADWISAVYAYEWGRRLDPADAAIAENLQRARSHLVADVFPSSESDAAVKARAWLARVPGRMTLLAGIIAWSLGFLLLAARLRGRLEGWTWLGIALILLSLPAFAHAAWQRERLGGRPEGILQATEISVRSGPGPEYQELFELHAGTLVEILETRPGWRRVVLPSATEGWVEARDVAVFGDLTTLAPR